MSSLLKQIERICTEIKKDYNLSKTLVYAAQLRNEIEKQKMVLEKPKAEETQKTEHVSQEITGTATFKVTGTKSQITSLREYMKSNGITFEVIR